ncbi:MAG: transposase family protein [Calditrichaeota bacterium]|nr:transposase family protein [Calditrichota bacterium]
MADENPVLRWTAKRRNALVLDILMGNTSLQEAARKHGLIDCDDREIIGCEIALRRRAKEAERAIEAACTLCFGTLRLAGKGPVLRSDNGLIFNERCFRSASIEYRLAQEFITPYTPQQNGMIERLFRSLKEECV